MYDAKLIAGNKMMRCKLVIFDRSGTLMDRHLSLHEKSADVIIPSFAEQYAL
jgi:hypothetical protein